MASGKYSHSEGYETVAKGESSHSEGRSTIAEGNNSHAEGSGTKTIADNAHAEGNSCEAGNTGHAEGYNTKAIPAEGKWIAHAEGMGTLASGTASHAEGNGTVASGDYSHAGGIGTIAKYEAQTVVGKYNDLYKFDNVFDAVQERPLFVVGCGDGEDKFIYTGGSPLRSEQHRRNAFEVYEDGSISLGDVKITPAQLQALLNLIQE